MTTRQTKIMKDLNIETLGDIDTMKIQKTAGGTHEILISTHGTNGFKKIGSSNTREEADLLALQLFAGDDAVPRVTTPDGSHNHISSNTPDSVDVPDNYKPSSQEGTLLGAPDDTH